MCITFFHRVANVQSAVGDNGVVPRLAADRLESGPLVVSVRIGRDEHDFARIGHHIKQWLSDQQQQAAGATRGTRASKKMDSSR